MDWSSSSGLQRGSPGPPSPTLKLKSSSNLIGGQNLWSNRMFLSTELMDPHCPLSPPPPQSLLLLLCGHKTFKLIQTASAINKLPEVTNRSTNLSPMTRLPLSTVLLVVVVAVGSPGLSASPDLPPPEEERVMTIRPAHNQGTGS